jgi:hypothetical protein
VDEAAARGTPSPWVREPRTRGKHRTEVTEATEGDLWLVDETSVGDTTTLRGRTTDKGKHRTEVTEEEVQELQDFRSYRIGRD